MFYFSDPSDEEAAMTIEFFFGYIKDHQFATNRHDALFDFVNHMSDKGGVKTTPLRMALIKKFYKVVKTLLHNNADVSLKYTSRNLDGILIHKNTLI